MFDNNLLTFEQRAFAFFLHSVAQTRFECLESCEGERKKHIEQIGSWFRREGNQWANTALREGISIYVRSKMKPKTLLKTMGGNKRYLCTEQTKWWIWNSSGPVLLTWKIALWIICAWLNRLWSVKSTQTLRRPAQHYSLVITEIRGIPWRALRVDSQHCLIMHRLLQKRGGRRMNWSCGGDQEDTGGAIPHPRLLDADLGLHR